MRKLKNVGTKRLTCGWMIAEKPLPTHGKWMDDTRPTLPTHGKWMDDTRPTLPTHGNWRFSTGKRLKDLDPYVL
ncbi:hypothetical protein V6N13_012227 [Hibiscus sabdariffa]